MRFHIPLLVAAASGLLASPARPQDGEKSSPEKRADVSTQKVRELQKERIATLKDLADVLAALYQKGAVEASVVGEAKLMLFQAEMEVAATEADRVAICQKTVDALKEMEAMAKAHKQAARGTEASVLMFKALRLEAEIKLEQAKSKLAKKGK